MSIQRDESHGKRTEDRRTALRRQAEELKKTPARDELARLSHEEVRRLLYELRIHQIELEIQNEELRTTQEALQAAQARYFSLYDLAPVGYLTLSEEGVILEANLTAARMIETTRALLPPRPFTRYILPDDQDIFYFFRRALAATQLPQKCELRLKGADGACFWAQLDGVVAFDDRAGAPVYRVTINDVSERKQVEAQLRRSERNLAEAERISHSGSWEYDIAADSATWSPNMFQLVEADTVDGLDQFIENRVYVADRPMFNAAFQAALAGQQPFKCEFRFVRKDGSVRTLYTVGDVIRNDRGEAVRMNGRLEDITEHKQLEQTRELLQAQLAQAQRMELVGRLAGGVAHEFNNRLAVILACADMSLPLVAPDTKLHQYLTTIKTTGQHSSDLVRRLLGFAQKQTISPRPLDLNAAIAHQLPVLHTLLGGEIELVWQPGVALWPVLLDPQQLDQILINLCANARDAIAGRPGKVTLQTNNVQYLEGDDSHADNKAVRLTVQDTGCGMDKELLAHIFEPFFTTKPFGQGVGLGLATVKGIIEQNQGQIAVFSDPGRGATFQIDLPRTAERPMSAGDAPLAVPLPGNGEQVLLVGNDPYTLTTAADMLYFLGYAVSTASTSRQALWQARRRPGCFNLLITDTVHGDGRLAAQISAVQPEIKVLHLSDPVPGVSGSSARTPADAHVLEKPYSLNQLAAKVREVITAR